MRNSLRSSPVQGGGLSLYIDMKKFFKPSSIAVIGAGTRRGGGQTIKNLLFGYKGKIYPVNPGHKKIQGIPCFRSIAEIPSHVDLAIILVPAPKVPAVLEECAHKRITRVMIESAGFAEVGVAGREIQDRCVAIAKESGIRIWGPNGMGLVDIPGRNFFTFMTPRVYKDGIIEGRVSLIVQSGMLSAGFLVDLLSQKNIGVSKVCSIGNKADVDECDLLPYLIDDPEADVVALYLESVPRGRLLLDIVKESVKPIVVLKGGKSRAGAQAAMSHTASLAGDSRLLSDVLESAGVTLATDFHQLIDLSRTLAMNPGVAPACRLATVSFSGAAGIVSCDLMEKHGLKLARLSENTTKSLGKLYPDWMPAANPVDLYPAMELHWRESPVTQAISILLKDPGVDVVLVHFVAGLGGEELDLAGLKKKADQAGKVVVFWLLGRREANRVFRIAAQECGIQVYDEISRVIECLAAAARFHRDKTPARDEHPIAITQPDEDQINSVASPPEGQALDEYESKKILKKWDIPVVEEMLVTTMAEAKRASLKLRFPLVLKGLPPGQVVHKTELGLVKVGISRQKDLEHAFRDIKAKLGGRGSIIVQRQVETEYELIAGFFRDTQIGPCIMFGLGGIFSELEPDVRFAPAPLVHADAIKLIGQIRGQKLLNGFRGMTALKTDVMAELLVNLGHLSGQPRH
ncbi:MAG: acetate--CoA ligase family protein [Planctomycetes bacterium]|nr:acetate--CoA ligase family protein [Planctomycetota bacterium]